MAKRAYGYRPDIMDFRDFILGAGEAVPPEGLPPLPPLVDLRDKFPPVWNQGSLQSCVGQSTAAAIQFDEMMEKEPEAESSPSRLFIYYNARSLMGGKEMVKIDAGATIRDAVKSVTKWGVCKETSWPYQDNYVNTKPSCSAYSSAKVHKALVYSRVNQNLDSIKRVLFGNHPVIFGMAVYNSFESDEVEKTGMVPMPSKEEKMKGGHACVLCGFSDDKQCFIVRNSWGENWGDGGYFLLPYNYATNDNLAADFWVITRMS